MFGTTDDSKQNIVILQKEGGENMNFFCKLIQIITIIAAALLLSFLLFFVFLSLFDFGQSFWMLLIKLIAIGILTFLWGLLLIAVDKML